MTKYIFTSILLLLILSCKKDDACKNLVNGVYQFPEIPVPNDMTHDEINEYIDLKEDICKCISTEGLIETCSNYPYLYLINAGANPQSGYTLLVRDRFRGVRELETRSDRGTYLLKKYKKLDPTGYNHDWDEIDIARYVFEIYNYEIILSQYINIESFTDQEEIEVIQTAISIYDKIINDEKIYSLEGLATTSAVMARVMKVNDYLPFMNLYNNPDESWNVVDFYWPATLETTDLIYQLSKNYLKTLKI
ncbi:MAG: hypothetical protein GY756_25560 [bacterium]|nr:hypothetical protein [bacterium]